MLRASHRGAEYEALTDLEAQMRSKLREKDKSPFQNTKVCSMSTYNALI